MSLRRVVPAVHVLWESLYFRQTGSCAVSASHPNLPLIAVGTGPFDISLASGFRV